MRRAVAAAPPPAGTRTIGRGPAVGVVSRLFARRHGVCALRSDDAAALLGTLADATRALSGASASPSLPSTSTPSLPPPTAMQTAATIRVCFGEMLEALAASVARTIVGDEQAPSADADKRALSLLYYDSYCAAVWTSAHAEYLGCIQDLLGERAATEALVREFMVPPPDLYTVTNMSHLMHLGALMERTASPRCCSKSSQALLAILTRVTNAGSRGWETTLLAALKESDGAVRVCMQCLAVALTGLNPAVHPGVRRPWRERFALIRALRVHTQQDFKEIVQRTPTAIKEAIRLHLAATFIADRATLDAMRHARHPTGQLCVPPMGMPAGSLAAAMHRMVDAGAAMVAKRESAAVAIKRHLVSEPRSRKKAESRAGRHPKHEPEPLSYSSSWLGGRSGPSCMTLRPAVQVVSGLLSASYRATFIPFWLHGNHHGHRASRLDSAQYAALHHQSAAHRMCTLLLGRAVTEGRAPRLGQRGRVAPHRGAGVRALGCPTLRGRHTGAAVPRIESRRAGRGGRGDEPESGTTRRSWWRSRASRRCGPRCSPTTSAKQTRRRQARAICQRLLAAARARRGPVRRGALAPAAARHGALLLLRVPARRQLGAGQHGQGPGLQRAGAVGEHAHGRLRHVRGAHALRQALVGGAAHGGRARGVRRAARARAARAGGVAAAATGPAAGDHRCNHVRPEEWQKQHQAQGSGTQHREHNNNNNNGDDGNDDGGGGAARLVVRGGQVPPRPQVVLRAEPAGHQLWRRAAGVRADPRPRHPRLWELVRPVQHVRRARARDARVALPR